jgi:hypothetical protein
MKIHVHIGGTASGLSAFRPCVALTAALGSDCCVTRSVQTYYTRSSQLDFAHVGGVREQTRQMVHERTGDFHAVACARQPAKCGMRP